MHQRGNKQAFLILTDKTTDDVLQIYNAICNATKRMGETFILYHQKGRSLPRRIKKTSHFAFGDSILTEANYLPIGFNLVPGNNHFPVLQFAKENPNYDYYWCIEDDVRFSGKWQVFFNEISQFSQSFISSHIRTSTEEPEWYWWNTLAHPYTVIPFKDRIRSFNPIYRISNAALRCIDGALQNYWCGHHEVLLPTLLHNNEFEIMDFGGDGQFVPSVCRNKFYVNNTCRKSGILTDGTMRWRPVFKEIGPLQNKLYHPVKG